MKTIFYKNSEDGNGDFFFDNKPYVEWFTLDNELYQADNNITRSTLIDGKVRSMTILGVKDRFSDEGIIRRIGLYISNY